MRLMYECLRENQTDKIIITGLNKSKIKILMPWINSEFLNKLVLQIGKTGCCSDLTLQWDSDSSLKNLSLPEVRLKRTSV